MHDMEDRKESEQKPNLKAKVQEMADRLGVRDNLFVGKVGEFMADNSDVILNHVVPALGSEDPAAVERAVIQLRFTAAADSINLGTPDKDAAKDPITLQKQLGFYAAKKTQLPEATTSIPDVNGKNKLSVAQLVEKTVLEMAGK